MVASIKVLVKKIKRQWGESSTNERTDQIYAILGPGQKSHQEKVCLLNYALSLLAKKCKICVAEKIGILHSKNKLNWKLIQIFKIFSYQ